MAITYVDAGVDQTKKDQAIDTILEMIKSTHDKGVIDLPWGFAGLYSLVTSPVLKKKRKDPVLVACTDGVGTKLKLARQLGIHDTVGIDLVAMSVNDLLVTGAAPLFFLDVPLKMVHDYVALPLWWGVQGAWRRSRRGA